MERPMGIAGEISMAKHNRPTLKLKQELLRHSYDLFLMSQTRLYVQAQATAHRSESEEIDRRRELLLLDDLVTFAIAVRRLIEMTGLKSFANGHQVRFAYLDRDEEPYVIAKSQKGIGFHTLMNRLVHANSIEHFSNKEQLSFFLFPPAINRDVALYRAIVARKSESGSIEQLLMIANDDEEVAVLISIKDMIGKSIEVAEKILEVCSDEDINLDLTSRE
jgi:hypothetical protein